MTASQVDSFLSIVGNPLRRKIIEQCLDGQQTLTSVTKGTNQKVSTIQKHLEKLVKTGLLKKKNGKIYGVTSFGKAVFLSSSSINFLERHLNYFSKHGLGDLPVSFVKRLGSLTVSQPLPQINLIFPRWTKIVKESDEYVYGIFTQPPILIEGLVKAKLQEGMYLRLLFGKNSVIPDCSEFVNKLELNRRKNNDRIEKRLADEVLVNLIMSEKSACLMFPSNGTTDLGCGFCSDDPQFLKWCRDFFNYKWNNAEPISRLRKNSWF